MKIGIVTFWWGEDNYGQQLQLYALQRFLNLHGHEAFLICYDQRSDYKVSIRTYLNKITKPKQIYKYLEYKLKKSKSSKINSNHPRYFEDFQKQYISKTGIYNSFDELKATPPVADAYIVGSDQVWNPDCLSGNIYDNNGPIKTFFLDFVPENRPRLSYAASWGGIALSKEQERFIAPLLKKFTYVSVREQSGIDLCLQCGVSDAEWVCDPTLLFKADDYRKLYEPYMNSHNDHLSVSKHIIEDYILLYYLDNGGKFDIDQVYKFAKSHHLTVKYITANGQVDKYEKIYPNLMQWLELVDHAKYIITNSFHCCVFSVIFKKQFISIPISGRDSGMNDRLKSLFKLCEMKPRILDINQHSYDFSILNEQYDVTVHRDGGKRLLEVLDKLKN